MSSSTAPSEPGAASGQPKKRRTQRRPERREELLMAAAKLFHERGYHATGMNDIGAAAGITGPGVYRHFQSKEEILETLATEFGAPVLERASQIAQSAENPRDALAEMADLYVATMLEYAAVASVAVYELRTLQPRTRASIERLQRLSVEEWVHVLIQARPDLPDGYARVMVRGVQAMALTMCADTSGIDREHLRQRVTDMIVKALLAD
ncbi:MAG: helix-turn-helix transcriptional regulator [Actinobacteria bacterium]|nr:helix-turn-helix transcriptional regulator [Actinomycetota bacterium]MBV8959012.1 helix-turn-helix transcriptional regulator [Actinomycetota bacterium]MBV9254042.1 helix-turn-helix transcriptional regulator [Actinomycetota bacterium]MBV9665281.1 helix-turn-helix transcriptional regulator [Actinomycetota bacterium]MBV9936044.1 helix-turn-helix transcriptional regulator [Actinomycetota bacterium]